MFMATHLPLLRHGFNQDIYQLMTKCRHYGIHTQWNTTHAKNNEICILQQNGYNWRPLFLLKQASSKRQISHFLWFVDTEYKKCNVYEQCYQIWLLFTALVYTSEEQRLSYLVLVEFFTYWWVKLVTLKRTGGMTL